MHANLSCLCRRPSRAAGAKHTAAQANLGPLRMEYIDDDGVIHWREHPITKITRKRIFVRDGFHHSQTVVDREAIERHVTWDSCG
jgi:hypothetical protein